MIYYLNKTDLGLSYVFGSNAADERLLLEARVQYNIEICNINMIDIFVFEPKKKNLCTGIIVLC